MRRARIALIVGIMLVGSSALQAQMAHRDSCDGGACQSCQHECGCGSCGAARGIFSSISASLQHALSGVLPGGIGGDARHSIYKAALQRNSFDKKYRLPVAYYSHILPVYKHNRCCTGSNNTTCPTCGPHGVMGEDVIEMHEVPEGMQFEPTPADQPSGAIIPGAVVPPKEARKRVRTNRSASHEHKTHRATVQNGVAKPARRDRVARRDRSTADATPTLRKFAPIAPTTQEAATAVKIRQVSAVQQRNSSDVANPLR